MQILLQTASSSAGVAFPQTLLHVLRKAEADDGNGDPTGVTGTVCTSCRLYLHYLLAGFCGDGGNGEWRM